ncbi:hypothetical protein EDB86DRAFT_2097758 [Lactarius hatsudake]|nr:hypothetical protein EDB86DRAFT_2097758 [Lactarius hatsudake]
MQGLPRLYPLPALPLHLFVASPRRPHPPPVITCKVWATFSDHHSPWCRLLALPERLPRFPRQVLAITCQRNRHLHLPLLTPPACCRHRLLSPAACPTCAPFTSPPSPSLILPLHPTPPSPPLPSLSSRPLAPSSSPSCPLSAIPSLIMLLLACPQSQRSPPSLPSPLSLNPLPLPPSTRPDTSVRLTLSVSPYPRICLRSRRLKTLGISLPLLPPSWCLPPPPRRPTFSPAAPLVITFEGQLLPPSSPCQCLFIAYFLLIPASPLPILPLPDPSSPYLRCCLPERERLIDGLITASDSSSFLAHWSRPPSIVAYVQITRSTLTYHVGSPSNDEYSGQIGTIRR